MRSVCLQCGNEYKGLGRHWFLDSECDYPDISQRIKDIFEGVLMGDGNLYCRNGNGNSRFRISNSNVDFLYYLMDIFGNLVSQITVENHADELFDRNDCIENPMFDITHVENYSPEVKLDTVSHPYFNELNKWYSETGKVWPEDLKMTPLKLKMWYCCDGNIKWTNSKEPKGCIQITCSEQYNRKSYLKRLFSDLDIQISFNSSYIYADVENSKKIFNIMGNPPPGMEYKWCYDNKKEYQKLKQ